MGFSLLKFSFVRYVVMSDYTINPEFADSVAKLPRLTIAPEASTFDSTYWREHPVLPLNVDEEAAYKISTVMQRSKCKLEDGQKR